MKKIVTITLCLVLTATIAQAYDLLNPDSRPYRSESLLTDEPPMRAGDSLLNPRTREEQYRYEDSVYDRRTRDQFDRYNW